MSHGYIVDSIRHIFRSPSNEVIAGWPENMNILETGSGKIRVQDTGGKKPALIMVPDGPCVIEHYEQLITELSDHFRVVCFDMPGFGFSFPESGYDFSLDKSAEVVISVLDALKIERAILSFSCVNSFVAMAVAAKYPERVSRLVLAQTPSLNSMRTQWIDRNIPKPLRIPFVGQVSNAAMSKTLSSKWHGIALPRNSSHKESFISHSLVALQTGGCFCLASTVQGMACASENALNGIEVPTMMIWGNKDWSHKNTNFETMRDHIPECEFHEFDGCGHFPNLENPKAFSELLRLDQ